MAGLAVYLMGAVSEVLVDLRNEWAVQTLVLISFALQVFLLVFARIRRQNIGTLTRFLLWLAYQLADSTALFTLGHMAIRARSPDEQQLMAFWAPFLLVHLGGQDTITAYSFEDNRLWLRHLQTLVVQIIGAAYVLYKYIPRSQALIRVASILMFVVGGLKYGERIWVLRSASMDSIWSSLDTSDESAAAADARRRDGRRSEEEKPLGILQELVNRWWDPLDDEDVLMASHGLLDMCKGIFIGTLRLRAGGSPADCIERVMRRCRREDRLDMLMEMELSLMYDIMYTKAAVIHTWYGLCIRVVAPVATAVAFLLFFIDDSQQQGGGGHGHTAHNNPRRKKNDVVITYILLAGALVLETVSLAKAAVSTWAVASLHAKGWARGFYFLRDLRLSLGAAGSRRWSGTVGQYNLLQSWADDMVAETMGLGSWWSEVRHSLFAQVSPLSPRTKELLLREIFEMSTDRRNVSSRPGLLAMKYYGLDAGLGWSVQESDIESSIIAWHVATDLYHRAAADSDNNTAVVVEDDLLQASQELSTYMMFLFVVRPYMLPGPVRRSQYARACGRLDTAIEEAAHAAWHQCGIKDTELEPAAGRRRLHWVLRTVRKHMRELPLSHLQVAFRDAFLRKFDPLSAESDDRNPALGGFAIALELGNNPDRLQVIFGVWVEMLCFLANHCSRESHAARLSCGGELVTIAWLMAKHANLMPTITAALQHSTNV